MKIERIENIGIYVKNLDEAVKLFSEIFGVTLVDITEVGNAKRKRRMTEHADRSVEEISTRKAIDRTGFFQLVEKIPSTGKEGPFSIHFKVSNLKEAKAEMERKGIPLITDVLIGGVKEAIYDVYGTRICLVEYEAPTELDAVLEE